MKKNKIEETKITENNVETKFQLRPFLKN